MRGAQGAGLPTQIAYILVTGRPDLFPCGIGQGPSSPLPSPPPAGPMPGRWLLGVCLAAAALPPARATTYCATDGSDQGRRTPPPPFAMLRVGGALQACFHPPPSKRRVGWGPRNQDFPHPPPTRGHPFPLRRLGAPPFPHPPHNLIPPCPPPVLLVRGGCPPSPGRVGAEAPSRDFSYSETISGQARIITTAQRDPGDGNPSNHQEE